MSKSYYYFSLSSSYSALSNATCYNGGNPRNAVAPTCGKPQKRLQHSALIMLIGLPGSGKSTLARQLITECPQIQLISTDAIRGQLFGNEILQGSWCLIWQEIERQFQQALAVKKTAIFDATNARRRDRREIITLGRELGFTQITGLWLTTPVWLCLARNKKRDRKVPEDVILRMHRQLRDAPPSINEGLDCLIKIGVSPM